MDREILLFGAINLLAGLLAIALVLNTLPAGADLEIRGAPSADMASRDATGLDLLQR